MIAHIDADSFFASVIIRTHPQYAGKALIAVGMGGGCVIAATYEAKAKGIKTGMRLTDARKLCPGAVEMAADFRETALASKQIEATIMDDCPIVQQMSIDEWYLDLASLVGGIPADLSSWGQKIQKTILQNTGLSVSIGIAQSKLLAKLAGEYKKPAGVTVVERKNSKKFLQDRPAAAICGIGQRREHVAQEQGWHTAWDIATADKGLMKRLFGKPGLEMQRELLGEQVSPVSTEKHPPKSISRCRSFRATTDRSILRAHVLKHLEYCTMKMRRWNLGCTDVSLWLRDADMHHASDHRKLLRIEKTTSNIMKTALSILDTLTVQRNKRYTQVGLALYGLKPFGTVQYSLFEDPRIGIAEEELQSAMDTLHARYGRDSITRAAALPVHSGTRKELDLPIVG